MSGQLHARHAAEEGQTGDRPKIHSFWLFSRSTNNQPITNQTSGSSFCRGLMSSSNTGVAYRAFSRLLDNTSVHSIVPDSRSLISFSTVDSCSKVIARLQNVLAGPVFNNENQCVGSIDIASICSWMSESKISPQSPLQSIMDLHKRPLIELPCFFQNNPVQMLIDLFASQRKSAEMNVS